MLVSALEGHRIWAGSYDASLNPLLALESRLLPGLFGESAAKRVIDVACGTGRWMAWFAGRGASVLGIDFCEEMLARVPASLHGCVTLGRAEALPVASNVADVTVCSFAAGYFCTLQGAVAEMTRITARGGCVILADLHPEAAAAGWTRSFRAAGSVYEIAYSRYSVEDLMCAARRAGLQLTAELRGYLGEPERPIFERAGRSEKFAEVAAIPAILAASWCKG